MKKTRDAIGDLDRWIQPVSKLSLRNWSSSFCSIRANGWTLQLEAFSPGISSTAWSHFLDPGRASKDSLEKTLSNSFRYSGMDHLEGAEAWSYVWKLQLSAEKHWKWLGSLLVLEQGELQRYDLLVRLVIQLPRALPLQSLCGVLVQAH